MEKQIRVVISPHADDEVLGCASVLGPSAHVFYVAIDEFHVVEKGARLAEVSRVAAYLNFEWSVGDCGPVNRLYQHRDLIVRAIEGLISRLRPQQIFLPIPSYNQDHQAVNQAALAALRHHDVLPFTPQVFLYEEPDNFLWDLAGFTPHYFRAVDIDRKIHAYQLHQSQVRAHRSVELLRLMASYRGAQAGLNAAEAFSVVRYVEH